MTNDTNPEYSVYQFFPEGDYEKVVEFVDSDTAVKVAYRLTESVGGRIGTTCRVIITDGGDSTVFEWESGKGVTFPRYIASAVPPSRDDPDANKLDTKPEPAKD